MFYNFTLSSFFKSAIFHDSLCTSFLCIENVLRIKREALLREGPGGL